MRRQIWEETEAKMDLNGEIEKERWWVGMESKHSEDLSDSRQREGSSFEPTHQEGTD